MDLITYVIFSQEELEKLIAGEEVSDEPNNISYVSEEGYKKLHEKWAKENGERWS